MKVTGLDQISQHDKELVLNSDVLDALKDFIGTGSFCNYLSEFVENTVKNIERIGMAIAAQDESRVRHLAHKLKASSGNIGAFKLAWNCVKLEAATIREEDESETVLETQSSEVSSGVEVKSQFTELEHVFHDTRHALEAYIESATKAGTNVA